MPCLHRTRSRPPQVTICHQHSSVALPCHTPVTQPHGKGWRWHLWSQARVHPSRPAGHTVSSREEPSLSIWEGACRLQVHPEALLFAARHWEPSPLPRPALADHPPPSTTSPFHPRHAIPHYIRGHICLSFLSLAQHSAQGTAPQNSGMTE